MDDAGRIFETLSSPTPTVVPTAIAITIEPAEGVGAPTGDVLFLGRTDQ